MLENIKDIYHDNNGVIGYRSMKIFLEHKGFYYNKATIHKYMNKDLRLHSIVRRKKPGYHSDQGSQYTSKEFVDFCNANKIKQSMSKAGCPYDNAPTERYFNTFKNEFYNLFSFETDEILNNAVYDFTYSWYNHVRPHSFNGGLTPFEARYSARSF